MNELNQPPKNPSNQSNASFFEKASGKIQSSLTIKLLTIGILILLLLIPLDMVQDLIRDREYRNYEAINEVNKLWGSHQTLKGPVLSIPYKEYVKEKVDDKEVVRVLIHRLQVFPKVLKYIGEVNPEKLHRGIYEVAVYKGDIDISGLFLFEDALEWGVDTADILWGQATLNFGMTDLGSVQNKVMVNWNDEDKEFKPGTSGTGLFGTGIHVPVKLQQGDQYNFNIQLKINGSQNLKFIPLGGITEAHLTSKWVDPKFTGDFIPDERTVNKSGFEANWTVLDLNRPIPSVLKTNMNVDEYAFGVDFILPANQYQKSMRSAKYAMLVIALTFLVFFFIQILQKVNLHSLQYILVGLALVIFYTLLVSISEFLSFNTSYLIAAGATILLVVFYMQGILKNIKFSAIIFGFMTLIYGFIFTIINLEDTSLLIGSIGLFIALAVVMIISRKVNWSELKNR
jgi:inner membrane protein